MIKFHISIILVLGMFLATYGQFSQNPLSQNGQPELQMTRVEKGQTLNDVLPDMWQSRTQTDIDPGISPEGDFMLRSAFTTDGSKIMVCNGGTNNIVVYNNDSMQADTLIDVGNYPCDIAITDNYAIVSCIFGDEIDVIDLSDYSIAASFSTPTGAQPCVVETSDDGHYAYIACDINDQCEVIDLETMTQLAPIQNFPVSLLSFAWISTGGRSYFIFTRFAVSQDNQIIVGNADHAVLYIDPLSGTIENSVEGIDNCFVTVLSGDKGKTIALSDFNSVFKVFQIDNATHSISASVDMSGNYLATYDAAVNMDGSKTFLGIGNNSSALVRFNSSDFITFTQTYTPFWLGTSFDHQFAVSGQYRFSIINFETETMTDQLQGYSQYFGSISPVANKVLSYDPLRYEGVYFFDFTNPSDIQLNASVINGWPPEGDTPYRIAISADGTRAVTSNSISHNASVINLESYAVDTIIELQEACDALAITHDSHWAVMGGYDLNTIKIIDLTTNALTTTVLTGQRPLMVAISPDDAMAYIGNLKQNSVSFVELDGANSTKIADISTGVIGLSWAANGVRSSVEIDPTGQYVLVAASFADKVQVIDVALQQIVADIPVGTFPLKIAFNASGEYAAVTNYNSSNFSIIHVDGANSSLVGTYNANGAYPLRLAFNEVQNEFGIIVYDAKKVINVNPETGAINSSDSYAQYGSPIMILYDVEGKPLVLTNGNDDAPGYLVRDGQAIALPAAPTYFDYCPATHTAVVNMPGPDYVSVIEYALNTDPPVADFTANVTTIQMGQDVEFTDLSSNNPTTWYWTFEGGIPENSVEQNPVITYEDQGLFDVSLVVGNTFGSDSLTANNFILVDTLTFIGQNGIGLIFSISPNPVSDILKLSLDKNPETNLQLILYSVEGKLMYKTKINSSITKINMLNWKPGIYILEVSDGIQSKKIKIQKN